MEKKIIRGLKNRDNAIFQQVYDRYWSDLYVSAFNLLRDKEKSEDIVQEVFANLWNSAESLDIKNLGAWLFTSIRYQVFNVLRSDKVKDRFELLYFFEESSENIGELKLLAEDFNRRISKEIDDLPDRCREIFLLSRFEMQSNRQIAEKFSISIKSVENQISIAQKRLRKSLKDFIYLIPLLLLMKP